MYETYVNKRPNIWKKLHSHVIWFYKHYTYVSRYPTNMIDPTTYPNFSHCHVVRLWSYPHSCWQLHIIIAPPVTSSLNNPQSHLVISSICNQIVRLQLPNPYYCRVLSPLANRPHLPYLRSCLCNLFRHIFSFIISSVIKLLVLPPFIFTS